MPVQQHAFEDICTYLMTHIVRRQYDDHVQYMRLGVQGQTQWGLDVVTNHPKYAPIVGQCKHRQPGARLKVREVMDDLAKTNAYERPIERYFVITNSERDANLQTALVGYVHQRPDGTMFPVKLIYWEQLHDLSFIPKEKLRLYFPEQAYHARHFLPPTNMDAVADAYDLAPNVLSHWFTEGDINEIEISPTKLKMPSNLWHKINLFQQAVDAARLFRLGVTEPGQKPCVRQIFRALPAIEVFAFNLLDYKKSYADLDGLNSQHPEVKSRLPDVQQLADSVASVYRRLCYGDLAWDNELAEVKRSGIAWQHALQR